ncbi:hypothetical protein BH23GEM6_BH23GEM6_11140 [soil metagenome]
MGGSPSAMWQNQSRGTEHELQRGGRCPNAFRDAGIRYRTRLRQLPFSSERLERSAFGTSPPAEHVVNLSEGIAEARASLSILVAEDHRDSRDALRTLLEASGYRVYLAVDGAEAVEQALSLKPDLILMDIMMPRLDGLAATRLLREESELSGTPILALTAMDGVRELALEAGCDDYLRKPIEVPLFFQKVHHWIQEGRQPVTR